MASTEFAQFRLQQIRSIENQHVLEKANITLKQQIEKLQALGDKPPPEDFKPKLASFAMTVKDWLGKMKIEMEQTKSLCSMQTSQITFLNKTIQETLQTMAAQAFDFSSDTSRLANENAALQRDLQEIKKSLQASEADKKALKGEVSKLRGELEESVHARDLLAQNCSLLKEQVDTMGDGMRGLEARNKEAEEDINTLRLKVKRLEAFGGEALQAALDAQRLAALESDRVSCPCPCLCTCTSAP